MAGPLIFAAGGRGDQAHNIDRSLLCDGAAYASWTPGSAGNRKTWTFSCWVKRSKLGAIQRLLSVTDASTYDAVLDFLSTDALRFYAGGATILQTNSLYRDPSSHYHIVLCMNTTEATPANRAILLVNGTQITSFASTSYPALNADLDINRAASHEMFRYAGGSQYLEGYVSEIHFIDGQALDANDFGEIKAGTNNFWVPKAYAGSYGTNGFYLPFSNDASTTTLGEDASGNGNDWTLTGFTTDDSVEDTPTNNFAVLNPLNSYSAPTQGNLTYTTGIANWASSVASFLLSEGKWYWEVDCVSASSSNYLMIGIYPESQRKPVLADFPGSSAGGTLGRGYYNGNLYINSGSSAFGATFTTGDKIGLALDVGSGEIEFFKNGVSQGTSTGLSGAYYPAVGVYNSAIATFNFGQKPFAHTPPAGFLALSTANLDNPGDTSPLTGSFTGNASADGPFVYLGYPPDKAGTCTINGNAITWGTHADALANGFKLRTSSTSYNLSGTNTYSIAIDEDASFADNANAQVN